MKSGILHITVYEKGPKMLVQGNEGGLRPLRAAAVGGGWGLGRTDLGMLYQVEAESELKEKES